MKRDEVPLKYTFTFFGERGLAFLKYPIAVARWDFAPLALLLVSLFEKESEKKKGEAVPRSPLQGFSI